MMLIIVLFYLQNFLNSCTVSDAHVYTPTLLGSPFQVFIHRENDCTGRRSP
jgi:hypothetical protein